MYIYTKGGSGWEKEKENNKTRNLLVGFGLGGKGQRNNEPIGFLRPFEERRERKKSTNLDTLRYKNHHPQAVKNMMGLRAERECVEKFQIREKGEIEKG